MKGKSRVGVIVFTVLLALSCLPLWAGMNIADDESDYLDPEYPVLTARDEVVTVQYHIEHCSRVDFFTDRADTRTLFAGTVPSVEIVNSGAYYVELTANQTVQDAIDIKAVGDVLTIAMQEAYYEPIYKDDPSYDYDRGLCVDSTAFEMTIYAPISDFRTDARLSLNMEAAKAEQVTLKCSYDTVQATIHGIDAQALSLEAHGDARVTLNGHVAGEMSVALWHNACVDAQELEMGGLTGRLSSRLFGLSRVRHQGGLWVKLLDVGPVITGVLVFFPVLWMTLDVWCLCRMIKRRKG